MHMLKKIKSCCNFVLLFVDALCSVALLVAKKFAVHLNEGKVDQEAKIGCTMLTSFPFFPPRWASVSRVAGTPRSATSFSI